MTFFSALVRPCSSVVGRPLGAAVVLEDDGAVRLHFVLLGLERLLVGVDVLDRHLFRVVGVFAELIAVALQVDDGSLR